MAIRMDDIGVNAQQLRDRGIVDETRKFITVHQPSFAPDIPEELLTIDMKIGDIHLQTNLREILYYGRGDLSEQDDREMDQSLDASSEYRISVGVALAFLKQTLEQAVYVFDTFEAGALSEAYKRIVDRKTELLGRTTQEVLKVTKDEKFAEMLSLDTHYQEWVKQKDHISELNRDVVILEKVDSVLKDRTMLLMSISKRRFTERTNQFLD